MRRTERHRPDQAFMEEVLREAETIYLAFNDPAAPYVLPLNFVYLEGHIYFHSATEGRKIDLIRANPAVGFTAAVDMLVDGTTTRYRSVTGHGQAEFLHEAKERQWVLKSFAAKYRAPCHFPVSTEKDAITAVIQVRIQNLDGKYSHRGEGPRPMPHYVR